MDYSWGNPVIVYTCDNCLYTTFGEAYYTDNKTSLTTDNTEARCSTKTAYSITAQKEYKANITTYIER
jgi:hypothetical protein